MKSSLTLFLISLLVGTAAYAESSDRSARAIDTARDMVTEGRAPAASGGGLTARPAISPSTSSGRTASSPSLVPSLGNGGGKSMNPIGAEQKFKNDLHDSRMKITSEGAKIEAKQASSGIGIGQKEDVTKTDQGTIDELKDIKNKNEDFQKRHNYCDPRCKKVSKGEDPGSSGLPSLGLPKTSPLPKIPKFETDEEKAARLAREEEAKKEKEAYDALSQKEKYDICMKDCMKGIGASWSSTLSKIGGKK